MYIKFINLHEKLINIFYKYSAFIGLLTEHQLRHTRVHLAQVALLVAVIALVLSAGGTVCAMGVGLQNGMVMLWTITDLVVSVYVLAMPVYWQ